MSHERMVRLYVREHYHELRASISDNRGYLRREPPPVWVAQPPYGLCLFLWRRVRYCSAIDPRPRGLGSEDLVRWAESLGLPSPVGPDAAAAQPYLYELAQFARELATALHLDPTACGRWWAKQIERHKANVSDAGTPFRLADADPLEGLDEFLEGIE